MADDLAAWARSAARATRAEARGRHSSIRVLGANLLHVTICFLGEHPAEQISVLAAELEDSVRPAVQLSVGAPLWLPPRRPRALAVELHDEGGALARVHAEVAARLEPAEELPPPGPSGPIGHRARPRRFRPHITVARLRSGGGRRSRSAGGAEPQLPPTPALSFAPAELVLYRSWLSPEGASYEALKAFPLGRA
jgi:2'-5' RNA ligase